MVRVLAPIVALALFAVAGLGRGASRPSFCMGAQLSGTFAVVPGSAGAGSIVYALRLTNRSGRTCSVTGLPVARLLGRNGRRSLPTHVLAAFPGALAAVLVSLAPGQATKATGRFSPDVPGTGDAVFGRCEPIAYWLRITARGGGSTTVRIKPPAPVCERGRLQFSAYSKTG